MKKRSYIKPQTVSLSIDTQAVLAAMSSVQFNPDKRYTDEEVQDLWESQDDKTIWSD